MHSMHSTAISRETPSAAAQTLQPTERADRPIRLAPPLLSHFFCWMCDSCSALANWPLCQFCFKRSSGNPRGAGACQVSISLTANSYCNMRSWQGA